MVDYREHLTELMEKTGFPPDSRDTFLQADKRLFTDSVLSEKLDDIIEKYREKRFESKKDTRSAVGTRRRGGHTRIHNASAVLMYSKESRNIQEK